MLVYISKLPSVQMFLVCMIEITPTSAGTEQAASMYWIQLYTVVLRDMDDGKGIISVVDSF